MPRMSPDSSLRAFTRFGDLLKFLRRRARLTQRELAIEVGYSEVHISRFEGSQRPPDENTLLALFVPALDLEDEPELVKQLLEMARQARGETSVEQLATGSTLVAAVEPFAPIPVLSEPLEPIPLLPGYAVARKHTLAWLREQLLTERAISICGMPGIGKTTLASALALERAASVPVFWLTLTLGVTAAVDVLVRQLALFLLMHGQQQVAPVVQLSTDGHQALALDQQVALIGAALARLTWDQIGKRNVAYGGLPLLCLDNVPPDDVAVTQVLGHLVASTPISMLLTSRADVGLPGVASIRPPGLDEQEGLELIGRLGVQLDAPLAERLLQKTDGSPMLLRLALGQLRNQRIEPVLFIDQLERQPQIAAYLIETMLRGLPNDVWCLISLVAVFRQPINLYDDGLLDLIQKYDGSYNVAAAVAEAQRRHLFEHPSHARLHPLLREHMYLMLSADGTRKRSLHHIAGQWSDEVQGNLVEAAYHYASAEQIERAVDLLTDQQQALIKRGQALAAVEIVDVLLARLRRRQHDDPSLLRHLLTLRGDLLVDTQRIAEAEANYRQALELTKQPTLRAQITVRLAEQLLARAAAAEAISLCRVALAALPPAHTLFLAQLHAVASRAHLFLKQYVEAQELATKALHGVEVVEREAPHLVGQLRVDMERLSAVVLREQEQWDQAADMLSRAIATARMAGLVQAELTGEIDMVQLLVARGTFADALTHSSVTLPRVRELQLHREIARLLNITSQCYLCLHEPIMALQCADQARDVAETIGDRAALHDALQQRIAALRALNRNTEAQLLSDRLLISRAVSM